MGQFETNDQAHPQQVPIVRPIMVQNKVKLTDCGLGGHSLSNFCRLCMLHGYGGVIKV